MTLYSVHNASEFDGEHGLFGLWMADSMDPPVVLIWANSWEEAYEVYLDEAAWSHTFEDVKEIWDHIDWDAVERGDADMPDYFHWTANGIVHTESIHVREVEPNEPTHLMAAILSAHEAAEMTVYFYATSSDMDLNARAIQRGLQQQGVEAHVVDWDFFDGRSHDIAMITQGRLTNAQHSYVVWSAHSDYDDEEDQEAVTTAWSELPLADPPVVVPPYEGYALFAFPGTTRQLEALDVEGVNAKLPAVHVGRGGRYLSYHRCVWTTDPTLELDKSACEGDPNAAPVYRQIEVEFGNEGMEELMVAQDKLLGAGFDGFIGVWPPLDGRVWKEDWPRFEWRMIAGQEEVERAKQLTVPVQRSRLRWLVVPHGQTPNPLALRASLLR